MNKISVTLVGIGILVLVALGYFVLKPAPRQPANQNQITNQNEIPPNQDVVEAVFDYKTGATAEPKIIRAQEGQKVRIRAASDIADEAHLHGYDISAEVGPGKEALIEFTAAKTGRFPIELEKLEKEIGIIEVYPK